MKAKELRIGDWVYNTHNRQNEQVAEIGSGLVMLDYNDLYEYDEIEPIPLSSSILVKNGFEVIQDYYTYYRLKCDDYSVSLQLDIDTSDMKEYWSLTIGSRSVDATISVYYVHQLQQALRLCGIEKEIVL